MARGSTDTQSRTTDHDELRVGATRTSTIWTAVAVGLVLVVLMLVFVVQNGQDLALEFLWLDFTLPAGVAMLLAAAIGGLIVVLVGAGRLLQVRRIAKKHRRADSAVREGHEAEAADDESSL